MRTPSLAYEIGRFVYLHGRNIVGFILRFKPEALDSVGPLAKVLLTFSRYGIPLVHFKLSRPEVGKPGTLLLFADMTRARINREELIKSLRQVEFLEDIYVIEQIFKGFIADTHLFPPLLFGKRVVIFPRSMYEAVIRHLREKLGDGYAAVLYYMGVESGMRYLLDCKRLVKGDLEKALKVWKALFQLNGFGRIDALTIDRKRGAITSRIYDCFECELFRNCGKPASNLVRGFIAGVASVLFDADVKSLEAKELRCIAVGDPYCEIIVRRVNS